MVKISAGTALVCEMVLDRYLDVLAENPNCALPDFKQMIVDAELDIRRARQDRFMAFERELVAVPTETPDASLIRSVAK